MRQQAAQFYSNGQLDFATVNTSTSKPPKSTAAPNCNNKIILGSILPGFPANSSFFVVFCRAFCGVKRVAISPIFLASGMMIRSEKGCDSSSSSKFTVPSRAEKSCKTAFQNIVRSWSTQSNNDQYNCSNYYKGT